LTDWIRAHRIRVFGRHGVYDHERTRGQLFEIDVELAVDTRLPASTDAVSDTVDYARVIACVRETVSRSSCQLIETLGHRIASRLLNDFPVHEVIVRVRKPWLKLPEYDGVIEVELRRSGKERDGT
jgi:dihydroneopterin aldolase